jgi:hypothetical protein
MSILHAFALLQIQSIQTKSNDRNVDTEILPKMHPSPITFTESLKGTKLNAFSVVNIRTETCNPLRFYEQMFWPSRQQVLYLFIYSILSRV